MVGSMREAGDDSDLGRIAALTSQALDLTPVPDSQSGFSSAGNGPASTADPPVQHDGAPSQISGHGRRASGGETLSSEVWMHGPADGESACRDNAGSKSKVNGIKRQAHIVFSSENVQERLVAAGLDWKAVHERQQEIGGISTKERRLE
eukprot:scaffold4958_cov406-Prasinococcus_capsulatus_cf.AAC.10